jgi:hypothetical protein
VDGPPKTRNPPPVTAGEGRETSGGNRLNSKDNTRGVDDYARARFRVDGQIKRILRVDALKVAPDRFPANVHRTVGCTWIRVGDVSLVRPQKQSGYHYKGLATCGSVHACPICASKIQERRRQEVVLAIAYAAAINRAAYMASFTFPHRLDQPLSLLLNLQQKAIKRLREGRGYKALMTRCKSAGRIRTLEVTHGQNGWHPHTHELLFLDGKTPAPWIRQELALLWLKSCASVGLFRPGEDSEADFLRHSVDVRAGDEGAASYMAKMDDQSKWGLSHELTKSSSKQGRRAGSHPFRLAEQDSTAHLFVEYVWAMKGQRQLVWSRGLKDAVGVVEKTDQEIAQEEVVKVDDRIQVPNDAWCFVLGNDARWELTYAAKIGGAPEVMRFLTLLGYEEPKCSPT